VLDVKRGMGAGAYSVWTYNGTQATGMSPVELAMRMQELGAGEVVVNSIDNDGVMRGYDLELIAGLRRSITLPMTALGGAGSLKDIRNLIARFGVIGAAAGSLFVFKGVYRAVLINYPNPADKEDLLVQDVVSTLGTDPGQRSGG
jgi:cyclase